MARSPASDTEHMNVVGHRGASGSEPENTPRAFLAADSMGADGVELDVRLARSGSGGQRLVVFHDPLPAEQEAVDALAGFDDVLDACGERMLVNVEIKNSADDGGHDPSFAVVAPTLTAMAARGASWTSRWLISSFDLDTIDECRRVAPEIATAFLVSAATDDVIALAVERGHVALHPWAQLLTEDRVTACHEAGLIVNTWTCNDPDRLVELDAMGVDGVCTDVPDVALDVLGRGGDPAGLSPTWGTPTGPPRAHG